MGYKIETKYRGRGGQYQGDLYRDGEMVGRVERGLTNGYHASDYKAIVDGLTIAMGRTMRDLREDLTLAVADLEQVAD
jgi:hypothetical protein